jgi:aspartate aminotransferase
MLFTQRTDSVEAINASIGNVSLPMHPALQKRMFDLSNNTSPFKEGVVKYTPTVGLEETNQAFKNIIAASGFDTTNLYTQITDGGSQAMELLLMGIGGEAGKNERPLLLLDAAYTNYSAIAQRLGRKTVSITRELNNDGTFSLPTTKEIKQAIIEHNPAALLVIPYDNPTGQYIDLEQFTSIAKICVQHNIWLVSDEAYRELHYTNKKTSSIWGIDTEVVPEIRGKRISIESASKVWNACGLRIGALVTDNEQFHTKAVAENTANLCSSAIGQYIFGALAHESVDALQEWFKTQRNYYQPLLATVSSELQQLLPGIIVSQPEASLYSVVDVKNIVSDDFDAADFISYCAREGKVTVDDHEMTLLVSPMSGFYAHGGPTNPGRTQMRISYVEPIEKIKAIPKVFAELLKAYIER